jgi:hypothetical protein
MISVANLHFSEIEDSGPTSTLENCNEEKGKDTRYRVIGRSGLDNDYL